MWLHINVNIRQIKSFGAAVCSQDNQFHTRACLAPLKIVIGISPGHLTLSVYRPSYHSVRVPFFFLLLRIFRIAASVCNMPSWNRHSAIPHFPFETICAPRHDVLRQL